MHLLSLSLTQFRNYKDLSLDFSGENKALFVGQNGSGKTNILESISVLSSTKSFIATEDDDIRTWGTEYYKVACRVVNDAGDEKELEVVSQATPRKQKACFQNGVRVPVATMVGGLPIVFFQPQDLSLFTGSPAERRRYLDQILCQVSPEYFAAVTDYQKILRQRNALLRSIREGTASILDLEPWDDSLAEPAGTVTLLRLELMETFSLTLGQEVRALGEKWDDVQIEYERTSKERDRNKLKREFKSLLSSNAERDVILQSTTIGPHRDDWHARIGGHSIQSFASRGQQRAAILALLFLQASYLELKRNEKPVILLDDVFSELDIEHRARVLLAFGDHQVFMTATEVPKDAEGTIWRVGEGNVMRYTATHG